MTATRRSREDWIEAAIAKGAEVGFERLAVEPLARRIGATKGSFYWHFDDRADLLGAVLERWEREATRAVVERLDPRDERAVPELLASMAFDPSLRRAEWKILQAADHPQVGPVVARVHEARIAFLIALCRARGQGPEQAEESARAVYALYLGTFVMGTDLDPGLQRAAGLLLAGCPQQDSNLQPTD